MITTREINVDLSKGGKLNRVTTKDIDASPKVKLPKKPIKAKGISTSNIADVADIREKKRRDDIAEEKKLAMKDEEKIVTTKEKAKVDQVFSTVNDFPKTSKEVKKAMEKPAFQEDMIVKEKKPWNKMNAKERKEYQIEKARKEKKE